MLGKQFPMNKSADNSITNFNYRDFEFLHVISALFPRVHNYVVYK